MSVLLFVAGLVVIVPHGSAKEANPPRGDQATQSFSCSIEKASGRDERGRRLVWNAKFARGLEAAEREATAAWTERNTWYYKMVEATERGYGEHNVRQARIRWGLASRRLRAARHCISQLRELQKGARH